ncbi:hypothetical protein M569_17750 [Genlisea aurea]|uniref:Uncharacterized protein n=1 Tax=Genlisea aurea TaxID=192259 RepID=S8BR21_9LAMI|nr:hypothetical protein M569_17750 [Genlisea aurea]
MPISVPATDWLHQAVDGVTREPKATHAKPNPTAKGVPDPHTGATVMPKISSLLPTLVAFLSQSHAGVKREASFSRHFGQG